MNDFSMLNHLSWFLNSSWCSHTSSQFNIYKMWAILYSLNYLKIISHFVVQFSVWSEVCDGHFKRIQRNHRMNVHIFSSSTHYILYMYSIHYTTFTNIWMKRHSMLLYMLLNFIVYSPAVVISAWILYIQCCRVLETANDLE